MTIYHVNGVLPRVTLRKRSPHLVFTEDSFADLLARSSELSAEYIFLRFVQNTMLLIGHSLNDSSLKNYLRRNRDRSPANHHYMIYWLDPKNELSDARQSDIFDANLELYNLITIFLSSSEIKEFLDVLNLDASAFSRTLRTLSPAEPDSYHYYIVGPVGAGKSTTLEQLRCFRTFEEWTRPPPPEMYFASSKIDERQSELIDAFVFDEVWDKNRLMTEARQGFYFMDRAPLDFYAFTEEGEKRRKKTERMKTGITPANPLHPGEIIFITADGDTLVKRNLGRGRPPKDAGSATYLRAQGEALRKVYEPRQIWESDKSSSDMIARGVARHALLGDYRPSNLMEIFERCAKWDQ